MLCGKFRVTYTSNKDLQSIWLLGGFSLLDYHPGYFWFLNTCKKWKSLLLSFYHVRLFRASSSWCFYLIMSKYSSLALKTLYDQCDLRPTFSASSPTLPDKSMPGPEWCIYFSPNVPKVISLPRSSPTHPPQFFIFRAYSVYMIPSLTVSLWSAFLIWIPNLNSI